MSWNNDWFWGRTISIPKFPERRFSLTGANDPRLLEFGFEEIETGQYRRMFRFFDTDPGFVYYPVARLYDCIVSVQSIHPDASPREAFVIWQGGCIVPPDYESWTMVKEQYNGLGWEKYVKVTDLELEQGNIPDWSATS